MKLVCLTDSFMGLRNLRVHRHLAEGLVASGEWRYSTKGKWRRLRGTE